MNDRLKSMLRQLRLSGLSETLEIRLQEAAGHQLSQAEFLELLLQDELLVRNQRLIARRVKSALTSRRLRWNPLPPPSAPMNRTPNCRQRWATCWSK